jgi:hypothetical protein
MRLRPALLALLPVVLLVVACQPEDSNQIARVDTPIVLEGSDLPDLVGVDPDDIVAFRHARVSDTPTWQQVPVQVDERKVVDFGADPSTSAVGGTTGTVYGTAARGITALQYADPGTFVGADPNEAFDVDDEVAFMLADAGGSPRDDDPFSEPAGVVPGSGVKVELTDPLTGKLGWIYLFERSAALDPAAGADYVDYDFQLTSGPYKTTYKTGNGPNPETSVVSTANYEIRYPDRWMDADWRVTAGDATGVDILDGLKFRFGFSTCGRSNATFIDAEGAFVANIDGPVRAIRSYVGANSGPLTQRTHTFYRDRHDIVTDLRVHSIPGTTEHYDFSSAAIGMTYRSSELPGGAIVDGSPDAVSATLPEWEMVAGPQGAIYMTGDIETSIPIGGDLNTVADQFFMDQLNSPINPCWGDDNHFLGAAGMNVVVPGGIPNTDPELGSFHTFQGQRTIHYTAPPSDVDPVAAGELWAEQVDNPVAATATAHTP